MTDDGAAETTPVWLSAAVVAALEQFDEEMAVAVADGVISGTLANELRDLVVELICEP